MRDARKRFRAKRPRRASRAENETSPSIGRLLSSTSEIGDAKSRILSCARDGLDSRSLFRRRLHRGERTLQTVKTEQTFCRAVSTVERTHVTLTLAGARLGRTTTHTHTSPASFASSG
jgi:hypothetical protein